MLVSDFSFELPDELIARYPAAERDHSRLLVLDRQERSRTETVFHRIGAWLRPGDLLVLNDTRVIPARLFGQKESGGRVEIFLVAQDQEETVWRCLLRASKPCRLGQLVRLADGVSAEVLERRAEQEWLVRFHGTVDFTQWLQQAGQDRKSGV